MNDRDLEQKIENEIENCCINILELLQKNGTPLEQKDVLGFSDIFFTKLDHQNCKVLRKSDSVKQSFTGE